MQWKLSNHRTLRWDPKGGIQEAWQLLAELVDVVIGVRMDDDMFYIHDGSGLKPRTQEDLRLERDDLFRKVGGITLLSRSFFEKEEKIVGGRIGNIVLDQKSAFTIKSKIDWQIAKALID